MMVLPGLMQSREQGPLTGDLRGVCSQALHSILLAQDQPDALRRTKPAEGQRGHAGQPLDGGQGLGCHRRRVKVCTKSTQTCSRPEAKHLRCYDRSAPVRAFHCV